MLNHDWLLLQLNRVSDAGWFSTRAQVSTTSGGFSREQSRPIRNVGVHAVAVEAITRILPSSAGSELVRTSLVSLWQEAIWEDGQPFWRWLKSPEAGTDDLPPDYDDTAWAYRATAAASSYVDNPGALLGSLDSAIASTDLCRLIEHDLRRVGPMYRPSVDGRGWAVTVYVGAGKRTVPEHVDPVVTAHVLGETLRRHRNCGCHVECRVPEMLWSGLDRLLQESRVESLPFSQVSRYYLSFSYFLYAIVRSLDEGGWDLVSGATKARLRSMLKRLCAQQPTSLLDASWAVSAARYAESHLGSIDWFDAAAFARSVFPGDPDAIAAVYQDPRYGTFFGSETLPIVFGYEALAVSEDRRPISATP